MRPKASWLVLIRRTYQYTIPLPVTAKHRVAKFQEISLSKRYMAMEGKTWGKNGFKTRVENAVRNVNNRSRIRAWWRRRAGWFWLFCHSATISVNVVRLLMFLTDVREVTIERDDTKDASDTVSAQVSQESTVDLRADENTPAENVRIRHYMFVCRMSSTSICVWFRF